MWESGRRWGRCKKNGLGTAIEKETQWGERVYIVRGWEWAIDT